MNTIKEHTLPYPVVPEGLEAAVDDTFLDAHAIMSSYDRHHVMEAMPDAFTDAETLTKFVELRPQGHDYDDTRAVVVPYPLGIGNSPKMYMTLEMIQRSLNEKTRIIGIPNNTHKEDNYSFETPELRRINDGSFDPLAGKISRLVGRRGVTSVDIIGYGQGASVAGAMIDIASRNGYFDVNSALLAEPPNITTRTKQKFDDFAVSPSSDQVFNALIDAQIPALSDVVGVAKGRQMPRFVLNTGRYLAGLRGVENKALIRAMSEPKMLSHIKSAEVCSNALLSRAQYSQVCPRNPFEYLHEISGDNVKRVDIKGYGHEAAENIALFALLAKMSIEGSNH